MRLLFCLHRKLIYLEQHIRWILKEFKSGLLGILERLRKMRQFICIVVV